jgi:cellulose synthase/poly-beta-1,6-N-acetylglucosamine synthase-like glycosyltransferase
MIEWLAWILVVLNVAMLPHFLLLLGVAAGALLAWAWRRRPATGEPTSRFLVLVPAHDEEGDIAATVASCRAADYPQSLFSVLVIADNCTDRTAFVAAEAGARVVERFDAEKKSKGFALEYLIGRLVESGESDALDALVVVDADTTIDADLLRRFDEDLKAGHDWIQSYYTVANPDQSWRTRLMTYAFSLFNGVMLLGQSAIGGGGGLRGNGMCFSIRGLRRRPWASYGLVEDMEFSWMLRIGGERIAFEPSARVYGAMVGGGGKAAATQRRRWEFGRGEIRRKYAPLLVRSDRLGWWEKLVSLLEITLPTMGALFSIYLVLLILDLAVFVGSWANAEGIRWFLLACAAFTTTSVGLYAVSPFIAMRLPLRYARSLVLFPVYVLWKAVISLGGRPKAWVRTPRAGRSETIAYGPAAAAGSIAPGDPCQSP